MKILFLNENPVPEVFTRGTVSAKELRLRAAISEIDEIEILTFPGQFVEGSDHSRGFIEKKIRVTVLPHWPYYFRTIPLVIFGFQSILKRRPITIESESPIISGLAAVLLAKLFNIPSIIEVRSTFHDLVRYRFSVIPLKFKQWLVELIYRIVINSSSRVICNSKYYVRQINKYGVITYEINPGLQNIKKHTNIVKTKNLIGFIGRLVKEKNVDCFIRAVEIVKEKIPNIKVEIAGDGVCRDKLETVVKNLNLQSNVSFLGMVSSSEVLPNWQLAVNPISVLVPLEMANVEAAYYRVPVICFGNDEYPETVVDGKTGWKIKSEISEEKLADKIIEVLQEPELLKRTSARAHDFAVRNYSFNRQVDNLKKLYRDLKVI